MIRPIVIQAARDFRIGWHKDITISGRDSADTALGISIRNLCYNHHLKLNLKEIKYLYKEISGKELSNRRVYLLGPEYAAELNNYPAQGIKYLSREERAKKVLEEDAKPYGHKDGLYSDQIISNAFGRAGSIYEASDFEKSAEFINYTTTHFRKNRS